MTLDALLDALAQRALPTGGWGYRPDQPIHIEPTCMALLALSRQAERFSTVMQAAWAALAAQRQADGSYRLARGRPQAVWPTALVVFTRATLGHPDDELRPSVEALLDVRGRLVPSDPEMEEIVDIDASIIGWPWAEHNFSWVEPTAWACLALQRAGLGRHVRVCEGIRLLLDRVLEHGGVNCGSRRVLGKMLEPVPDNTALLLLALQGQANDPRVLASARYLRQHVETTHDLEQLAWARLALEPHTVEPADQAALTRLEQRIVEELAAQPLTDRTTMRLALSALAWSAPQGNVFRLPRDRQSPAEAAQTSERVTPDQREPRVPLLERVKSKFRGMYLNGLNKLIPLPITSAVHIAKAESYDIDLTPILLRQFEHYRPYLSMQGKRVVLKPNLVEYHKDRVINTDPRFVEAVIRFCQAEGASEIIVAEGPGHWRNVEFLVEESGLGAVLRKHHVRFVDLNHDEPVKMLNLGRLTGLDYLYLTRTVVSADVFISLPKLKTHHWAVATLSLKNLFGTLPGICYGWPKNELHWRGIPQSIIDIALTHTPHLAIVDGIVGMEGDGPLNGTAKPMGVLVMGMDLVAVDATCCRLMKLPTERIPTLVLGAQKRLGRLAEAEIPQLGESIESLAQQFEFPPKMEKMLIQPKSA